MSSRFSLLCLELLVLPLFLSALFLTGTCVGLGDVHFLALDYALTLAVAALLGGRMFFLEGREVYLAADHRTCELLHPGLDVLHGLAVRLLRGCLLGGLPGGRSRSGFGRCRLLGSGSRFLVEVYLAQNLESGMILTAVFRVLPDGLGGFGLYGRFLRCGNGCGLLLHGSGLCGCGLLYRLTGRCCLLDRFLNRSGLGRLLI